MSLFVEGDFGPELRTNLNARMIPQTLDFKIQRLTDTAKLPTKGHKDDACFDIYADIPDETYLTSYDDACFGYHSVEESKGVKIQPHQTVIIPTGFATEIPHGFWGAIFARSGLASKQGLRPAQGVPVIDESYRGQWFIPLHNDGNEVQIIHHGDRICQFMLLPYFDTNLIEVNNLSKTDRGEGGFGSTGTN